MTKTKGEVVDKRPVIHWLFGQDPGTSIRPSFPGPVIFHFKDAPLRIHVRNTIADDFEHEPFMRPPDIPRMLESNTFFRPGYITDQLLLPLGEINEEKRRLVFLGRPKRHAALCRS